VDVLKSVGGQYFIGEFDGTRFINDAPSDQVLRLDYGTDFYAAQSWADIPAQDGRRIWLGWMSNWDYANSTPTSPWRGMFSIPRTLKLHDGPDGFRLAQQPVAELERLRLPFFHCDAMDLAAANAALKAQGTPGIALEIKAEFVLGTASEFGLKVRQGESEETAIGYDIAAEGLFVDRRRSGNVGFAPAFSGQHRAPLQPERDRLRLHIFVDACSVEVFGNEGKTVVTDLIFPDPQSTGVDLYAREGEVQLAALDVWRLSAAQTWPAATEAR
jgi:fructan beta-fructosidase